MPPELSEEAGGAIGLSLVGGVEVMQAVELFGGESWEHPFKPVSHPNPARMRQGAEREQDRTVERGHVRWRDGVAAEGAGEDPHSCRALSADSRAANSTLV
jgi:hypothetical protein